MEAAETQSVFANLEQLKRRARSDRRATSLPLLTFGGMALIGALAGTWLAWDGFYWVPAIPAGFGFLFWRQRRRASRIGVGEGGEPYGWFTLGFFLMFMLPLGFLVLVFPLAAIAAGLLFVAWQQRNRYLGVCAVIFGVIGTLEVSFAVISNRLFELAHALGFAQARYGYFDWSQELVVGLLAAFLLGAGLRARRREVRAA